MQATLYDTNANRKYDLMVNSEMDSAEEIAIKIKKLIG